MNTAIIVAAGSGSRFGGETPKQFRLLHGKPILSHTLSKFQNCIDIDEIVLVVAKDRLELCADYRSVFPKIKEIVAGGETRMSSVANGLRVCTGEGIIAVHDGARPFVKVQEISATISAARRTGAACLVTDVTDTIKRFNDGKITGTVDREGLRRALTPQCFRFDLLERAFAEADSDIEFTDESSLVEQMGISVEAVRGSASNFKITVEEDLAIAEAILAFESEGDN